MAGSGIFSLEEVPGRPGTSKIRWPADAMHDNLREEEGGPFTGLVTAMLVREPSPTSDSRGTICDPERRFEERRMSGEAASPSSRVPSS